LFEVVVAVIWLRLIIVAKMVDGLLRE
jgi:hypothetical protein